MAKPTLPPHKPAAVVGNSRTLRSHPSKRKQTVRTELPCENGQLRPQKQSREPRRIGRGSCFEIVHPDVDEVVAADVRTSAIGLWDEAAFALSGKDDSGHAAVVALIGIDG